MPVFVGGSDFFGFHEAMFALALRKIGFDQSRAGAAGTGAGTNGFGFGALASHSDRFWVAS